MASTSYEREANDLAWEVADKLTKITGHSIVVEGSTWRTKYLRIVDTENKWRMVAEFAGNRWEDVYNAVRSAWQVIDYIKED